MATQWLDLQTEVDKLGFEQDLNYLLFAMGLHLRTLDYDALRTENVLDGADDKKVDLFHIDYDTGVATIAQGFVAPDWSRPVPRINKAAELSTAVNWSLESDLSHIPRDDVRAAATQLRDALYTGDISRLDAIFVHNLPHSGEADKELSTVRRALNTLLRKYHRGASEPLSGTVKQLSRDEDDEFTRSLTLHSDPPSR